VVHDVFVTFIRNIADFKLTGSLKGYFSICVANAARSLLRKQKSHAQSSDFTVEPQARDASCPVESAEIAEHIRNSLANLPDQQREVVVLHVKAGLKFREIARIQQVSLSTVQGRYRYGIDKLRSYLNGELENETDREKNTKSHTQLKRSNPARTGPADSSGLPHRAEPAGTKDSGSTAESMENNNEQQNNKRRDCCIYRYHCHSWHDCF
jgi:RNA polymerase sigma-70 factor (ECF subfamily)